MTTLDFTLASARIKLRLGRYLVTRAACRAIRRPVEWLAPAG